MIGDHIRALKGGRWTHGIDCGDETILHASDAPQPGEARILRTYRPRFVAGASAVEVVAHREPVFAAGGVVARAFTPIRDPAIASMFRDSEAFAHWCKTGRLPDAPRNGVREGPQASSPPGAAARETPPPPEPAPEPEPPRRKRSGRKGRPSRTAKRKAPAGKARPKRAAGRKPAASPARKAPRAGPRRRRKGRR